MKDARFKVEIEHVLMHILFAWNARRMPWAKMEALSDKRYWHCCQLNELMPHGNEPEDETPQPRSGKFNRLRQRGREIVHKHWTRSEHELQPRRRK